MIAEAAFCVALAVYHEARSEPWAGRMAVALVVRNRAREHHTPICWQVFKASQFSFTLDPANLQSIPSGPAWTDAIQIARTALATPVDFTGGATHYHTIDSHPTWDFTQLEEVGTWGAHVFYKEKGRSA